MGSVFRLKYRDTLPVLEVSLLKSDGTGADITGSTAWKLHIKLNSGAVVTREMELVTANPGKIKYAWLAADWDANGGPLIKGPTPPLKQGDVEHLMEYEILGPGSARQTYPNDDYDTLRIVADLGQG